MQELSLKYKYPLMKKTFPSSAGDQEETEDGKENSQTTVVAISISRCLYKQVEP